MRIVFTGASSHIGSELLKRFLLIQEVESVYCGIYQKTLSFNDPKLKFFPLDLENEIDPDKFPSTGDTVIHFAGLTHCPVASRYWDINFRGTVNLAKIAMERGFNQFVFVSSWRAIKGAGAYGESKLAAEKELLKMPWKSLTILRPAEIYGSGSNEGLDRVILLAKRLHIAPMFFGESRIKFRPLFVEDFTRQSLQIIMERASGINCYNLGGPDTLSGPQLSLKIAKKFKAVPLPVWWPAFQLTNKVLRYLRLKTIVPDQLPRLMAERIISATDRSVYDSEMVSFLNQ